MTIRGKVSQPVLQELNALRVRQDEELRALVTRAAHAGARSRDIAEAIGVSRSTLWRHYGPELHLHDDRS